MLEKLLWSASRVFSPKATTNHSEGMEEGLITHHQRIIRLLSENDGKMWQQGLIEETGWTPSKMSRTLSAMEDKDQIVRKHIGREKLVAVPESIAFEQDRTSGLSIPNQQFSQ